VATLKQPSLRLRLRASYFYPDYERKGTPLFRMKLEKQKAICLFEHISEGCGVHKTKRLVGVNRNTVMYYSRLASEHAKAFHDELVAFSPDNQ
jgi:transposase-like protein